MSLPPLPESYTVELTSLSAYRYCIERLTSVPMGHGWVMTLERQEALPAKPYPYTMMEEVRQPVDYCICDERP